MKTAILGVGVDKVDRLEAKKRCLEAIDKDKKFFVVTINLEFIIEAQEDPEFKRILNLADLSIADSSRVWWLDKLSKEGNFFKRLMLLPQGLFPSLIGYDIVPGVDLMEELIKEADTKGWRIGLLGGKKGIAEKASERLQHLYKNISIVFAKDGGEVNKDGDFLGNEKLEIPEVDLLFVGFGQVKQEKWIYKHGFESLGKLMMGVGGAFDYISGEVIRAPKVVRALGFEWLFRLLLQPWRFKRQLKIIKFLITLIH